MVDVAQAPEGHPGHVLGSLDADQDLEPVLGNHESSTLLRVHCASGSHLKSSPIKEPTKLATHMNSSSPTDQG
jgi:hypothetical protein